MAMKLWAVRTTDFGPGFSDLSPGAVVMAETEEDAISAALPVIHEECVKGAAKRGKRFGQPGMADHERQKPLSRFYPLHVVPLVEDLSKPWAMDVNEIARKRGRIVNGTGQ